MKPAVVRFTNTDSFPYRTRYCTTGYMDEFIFVCIVGNFDIGWRSWS